MVTYTVDGFTAVRSAGRFLWERKQAEMRRLEVDKERFACALKDAAERQPEGIGMLREKLLHATLKNYFLEDGALPEQKVGKYIVDLLGKNGIMEIQTGSCAPLRSKLQALLPLYPVTVVCPIFRKRTVFWIDPQSGALSGGRKSPKTGKYSDILPELIYLAPFLDEGHFRLLLFLYDGAEYKCKDGWGKDGKRGAHRQERVPEKAVEMLLVENSGDCRALLPAGCPERFTEKEFGKRTGMRGRKRSAALKGLLECGVLKRKKEGRVYIYNLIYADDLG